MARTVLSASMGPGTRRTATALVLAVVLAVSGCGGDKKDGGAQGPPSTNADGTPMEALGDDNGGGDGAGGQDGGRGSATTTTARRNGSASPSPTSSSPSTPTTTRSTNRPPNSPDSGARGGPGAFARTLLRPQPATRIVVELLVQQGAEPTQGSIDHLLQVLAEESRKQVVLADRVTLPAGDGTTTDDDIRTWSDKYARVQQGSDQAALRLLFLKGTYYDADEDDNGRDALGVAVRGDTMAIFKETVRSAATPLVTASVIEDAVVTHELGHLLGLVDIVLQTGRADREHPGHSTNRDSVMFWAVESSVVGHVLGGPPSRNFDSADKADLAALRGGA